MYAKILNASLLLLASCASNAASPSEQMAAALREHVLFYASFDGSTKADVAVGDPNLYTAENRKSVEGARAGLHDESVSIASGQGLFGDALEFHAKERKLTYYKATENLGYDTESWGGAISHWLQLDPDTDLDPGFCDPIQITDVSYNDASIWVDFTKDSPRAFRLGVIGDLKAWNPDNQPVDGGGEFAKRVISVETPPFQRGTWTHILINFDSLNQENGWTELFLDGESMGRLTVADPFTWEPENARFMLGLSYIGLMDEVAVFDRPLTAAEQSVLRSGEPLRSMLR